MVLSSAIFYIVFSSSRCVRDHRYDSLNKTSKGKDGKERKNSERRGEERREREEKGRREGAEEQHSLEMKDT